MSRRPNRAPRRRDHRSPDRDYYGRTKSPRKRQRPRAKPVFVADIRVPFPEVFDFMNFTMRKQNFTRKNRKGGSRKDYDGDEVHVGDAIIGFEREGENCWRLEPATDSLADKLCYLNQIRFCNKLLRVSTSSHKEPRFGHWNDYYMHRNGRNDPLVDVEVLVHLKHPIEGMQIFDFLNEKMDFYELSNEKNGDSVEGIRGMVSTKSFVLTMRSPEEAERICYLSGIQLGHTSVALERPGDWIGPNPRFVSYLEFLRARSDSEAAKRKKTQGNAKESPQQANTSQTSNAARRSSSTTATIEILDDSDDEVQVVEEHEEEKKLEKENQHLRSVLKALTHSNASKSKEASTLQSQVSLLQTQLSEKESEASVLRENECTLKNSIATSEEKVDAIHESWQAQAIRLMETQKEIDQVDAQLEQLQKDAHNVEESLLDERRERDELENVLARFQPHVMAGVKKEEGAMWNARSKNSVAASDDAFDA
ncbi:MAG: hypothetical protein SGBAC_011114 [Bacillariaceae sp.]